MAKDLDKKLQDLTKAGQNVRQNPHSKEAQKNWNTALKACNQVIDKLDAASLKRYNRAIAGFEKQSAALEHKLDAFHNMMNGALGLDDESNAEVDAIMREAIGSTLPEPPKDNPSLRKGVPKPVTLEELYGSSGPQLEPLTSPKDEFSIEVLESLIDEFDSTTPDLEEFREILGETQDLLEEISELTTPYITEDEQKALGAELDELLEDDNSPQILSALAKETIDAVKRLPSKEPEAPKGPTAQTKSEPQENWLSRLLTKIVDALKTLVNTLTFKQRKSDLVAQTGMARESRSPTSGPEKAQTPEREEPPSKPKM